MTGGRRPRLDGALIQQLLHDGILVRRDEVPGDVHLNPRLGVPVPQEGTHRAGGETRRNAASAPAHAAVGGSGSPRLRAGSRLLRGPGLPPDIARRVTIDEPFLPAEDILWVRHAGSGIELPYTLTPDVARVTRELQRGGRDARSIPLPDALRAVGATVELGDVARERAAWRRQVLDWRRELHTSGCAVLHGLFTPIFVAAVREYYRLLERVGYLTRGNARRRGRPLLDDEPVLAFLGGQLAAVVRQVTRQRASSRFSFLRVYAAGAVLERHRDRPVCRWNIDLVVGGEPPPVRRTAWPVWIAAQSGRRAVRLGLGDGVLYCGTDVRHWRSAQPAGHSTVLACFHYGRPGSPA